MSSSSSSSNYEELLAKIEKLESDKRNAEQQILNWKFDELEKQLQCLKMLELNGKNRPAKRTF